jgi:UDP-glucuronate 4-epimerase
MKVLVTGAAGFIGYHLSERLLARGDEVVGVDNFNDYYDPALKEARAERLARSTRFEMARIDLADADALTALVARTKPEAVVNLAAQAGVRYSLDNPSAYVQSNLVGFANILEACRHNEVAHLVYASSSSVYGGNDELPFSVDDRVDCPLSLYAASKKANELMAHTYSHLFALPTTGLRFFTVYGPWGRPDMALFLFTKAILAGEPIKVFNHGDMRRDFTYIDDIVEGVVRVVDAPPTSDSNMSKTGAPYRLFNIGNNDPVELLEMIRLLEVELGQEAEKELLPMQPGDVPATYADIEALEKAVGFKPSTPLADGIARFVEWYREYHGIR